MAALRLFVLQTAEKHLHGLLPHLFLRPVHDGQRNPHDVEHINIIEADQADVDPEENEGEELSEPNGEEGEEGEGNDEEENSGSAASLESFGINE